MTTWTLQDYTPEEDEAWAKMSQEQQYNQERKDDMYWNNRIVKTTTKYTHKGEEVVEDYYEICEVYYNDKDQPCGYCKATVGGETLDEVRESFLRIAEAFSGKCPVLNAETDFNNKLDGVNDGNEEV